jgi:hypothetical protein
LVVVVTVLPLEQIMPALPVLILFYPQSHQLAVVVAVLMILPLRVLTVVQVVEHQIQPILLTVELELLAKDITEEQVQLGLELVVVVVEVVLEA